MTDKDKLDILFWGAIGYFIVSPILGIALLVIVWAFS